MGDYYILDGHKTKKTDDLKEWAECHGNIETRRVAKTEKNGVRVSTVFLGIDHSWGEGPPLLFETMVFGGEHDLEMERYTTWEEAEAGHKEMCERIFHEQK